MQDELTSSLIKLANTQPKTDENTEILIKGLFTTITNVNFDAKTIQDGINNIINQAGVKDFDIQNVWNCEEDIRSLKSLILFGLKGIAAYAHHARVLGYKDAEVDSFFYEALQAISKELTAEELLSLVLKTGEINLKCMELLDRANTET